MSKDNRSAENLEIFDFSDTDILSLGSSESEADMETFVQDNKISPKQAIQISTQEISYQVLNVADKLENTKKADNLYKHENQNPNCTQQSIKKNELVHSNMHQQNNQ